MSTSHDFKAGELFRVRWPLPAPVSGDWSGLAGVIQIRTRDKRRVLETIAGTATVNEDGTALLAFEVSGEATASWAEGDYVWDVRVSADNWGPHFTKPTFQMRVERPATQVG